MLIALSQALVRLTSCMIADPSMESTIATAHHAYILDKSNLDKTVMQLTDWARIVAIDAQTLTNVGMVDPSLLSVSFDCPTGNCSYPQYYSSGFCSKCIDNSEQVIHPNGSNTYEWKAANLSLETGKRVGQLFQIWLNDFDDDEPTIASIRVMAAALTACETDSITP
jgi:hypothetical protein